MATAETKKAILAELEKLEQKLSNPKELIHDTCYMAANLAPVWESWDYHDKQNFQNILFPCGLLYDTKIEHYRTTKVNSVFVYMAQLSRDLKENKNRTSQNFIEKSGSVPPFRPNMNDILEDTSDLARIWDLYGHLLEKLEQD